MRFWNIFLAFLNFVKTIYAHRSVLGMMARQEIKNRYAGTLAGLLWSFINPLMMILVYWFVFSVGFKIQPPGGYPFILVFLCGLVPWTLLSETLMSSSNVVIKNPHLVKKIAFPTEILPFVNLATSLITHGIMLVILIIIMLVNSVPLSWINLQFIYYLFALSVFITGLSWLVAAVNVFYRDISQALGVLLNLWFWMTPIVWLMEMIPEKYAYFLNFNPMMYIVMGYKYSFIYHIPFWHHYKTGIYFWSVSLLFFVVGGLIYRKLKMEFTEVL